jgi:hypothetical protein
MIWAKNNNISRYIWTIMRVAKRAEMMALSIGFFN